MEHNTHITPRGRGFSRNVPPPERLTYDRPGIQAVTRPPVPPTGLQRSRASSIFSTQSSTASRIKQNELDIKKKLADLEQEVEDQQVKVDRLLINKESLEEELKGYEAQQQINGIPELAASTRVEMKKIEKDIKLENLNLASLKRKVARRKDIIQAEGDFNNLVITEESDANNLELDLDGAVGGIIEPNSNVEDWFMQQQRLNEATHVSTNMGGSGRHPERQHEIDSYEGRTEQHGIIASPPRQDDSISVPALVTALQRAFPVQVQPTVVSVAHPSERELPQFSGKAEDWLIFLSEFNRKRSPDDGVNLSKLRKCLKGKAYDTVAHLLSNPKNINSIIQMLEQIYGNPKHIIAHLIKKAKTVKSPDVNKPESVIEFGIAVDALVTNIISYNMKDYENNVQLLHELVDKLPAVMKREWSRWKQSHYEGECLKTFRAFIKSEMDLACEYLDPTTMVEKKSPEPRRRRNAGVAAATEAKSCQCCGKENHNIATCFKFGKLDLQEKYKLLKEKGLCFKCLSKGHLSSNCPSASPCGIDGCDREHHKLLHKPLQQKKKEEPKSKSTQPSSVSTAQDEDELDQLSSSHNISNSINSASGANMCLIPVKVTGPKGTETVLALLDTGASFSMLESGVAERVGIEGKKKPLSFNVFGKDVRTDLNSMSVSLKVKGIQRSSVDYDMKEVRTMSKIGIPASPLNIADLKKEFTYLGPVKTKNIGNDKPQMIIGYDHHRLFCPLSTIEDPEEKGPSGHLSRLGWYVSGVEGNGGCFFACPTCHQDSNDELHAQMKDFFSIEDKGVKTSVSPSRSKEDKRALELLEKTTVKKGNRWETGLLWKEDNLILPPSKNMALNRLTMMEKKMDRDQEFGKLCCEKFDDYISKGYLVPAAAVKEKVKASKRKWYLPWFFAYHSTKKPRLVFDGAAKAGGKSLNDFLLKGPDLLNSLPDVLMKFRSFPVAVTADIKEMFHQVKLTPSDWPSQTILYRGMDRNEPAKEYFMTVLFFGSASSPCSAIYAKDRNALQFEKEYPAAVKAICENFYMDDYLGGANSVPEAIKLQQEMTWIHAQGGFELCKWNSSSSEVMAAISEKLRAERQQVFLQKGDITLEKTLGMWWNPDQDVFRFKLNLAKIPVEVQESQRKPTKREVTSFVMALFDPLGFLAPIKVRALIIIQNIWKSGIGWDVEVTEGVYEQWKSWLIELEEVRSVIIQRKYCNNPTSGVEKQSCDMHVFVDASEEAYSCALYFVFENSGKKQVSFVAGKARVAPLKGLTIPRMELQAALLGSRLADTVATCFNGLYNLRSTTFWGDSKTVLCWLRSETGRYKMFVQTRIGEILESTNPNQWRWVPTKLNVADDATRFRSTEKFSSSSRWLKGVDFILDGRSKWPVETSNVNVGVTEEDLELRPSVFTAYQDVTPFSLPDITHFSSWFRLIRATAVLFTYMRYLQKKQPYRITIEDQRRAEAIWIRKSQQESFSAELRLIDEGKPLLKTSRLAHLSPKLKDGVIVLGGRIDAAPGVSITVKNPPILDPSHSYTKLMLKWYHEISRHQGQERVISEVRKKAWVIDCRRAVRSCWANCQLCKLRKLQPAIPEMGQLPSCRLGEKKSAFAHTGVDYFGPYKVKVNRSIVKRWGVIFTCMTTRGVHLELADSLEAGEFLNVLTRFVCTRGPPTDLWCDNGSNFVGAKREMKEALKKWNEDDVRRALAVNGTEFHFQPPASPHMGGVFERLIGIAKRILSTMMKSQAPRESVLRTLLCQAMDTMNSRPLTYASTDPNDAEVLTPNHLLRQNCMESAPIPGVYQESNRYRSAWKYAQYLGDEFWRRWTDECLPIMAKRTAWREKAEPIMKGEVVILKDDLQPRSAWKKGIILKTYPGKDGQVRVVDVRVAVVKPGDKTAMIKVFRRPVVKIIPLGESVVFEENWEEECPRLDEK